MKTLFLVITALSLYGAEPTIKELTDAQKLEHSRLHAEAADAKAQLNAVLLEVERILPALTKASQAAASAEAELLARLRAQSKAPEVCFLDGKQNWMMRDASAQIVPCKAVEKLEAKK